MRLYLKLKRKINSVSKNLELAKKILQDNEKKNRKDLNSSNLSEKKINESDKDNSLNDEEDINDNFISFCPKKSNANHPKKKDYEDNFYNNFLKGKLR